METERYSRQIILKGFGLSAQQKLSQATVLVIGAGGLGCPALQYLAAAGVGHIGIIDDDTVSLSNLHRQILFSTADIDTFKAETAKRKLQALNPDISVVSYTQRLNQNNILELLGRYDYIVDATDNFESRYLINDACALLQKPLIFAAVSGYEGQLAVFNVLHDGQTTNYRDLFPIPPAQGEIPNCAENGVLGVLAGTIGTMQASEVIKLITGIGKPLINSLLTYNMLDHQLYEVALSPARGTYKLPATENEFLKMNYDYTNETQTHTFIEIDTDKMDALIEAGSTLLIDVREAHESPALDPTKYQKAPMSSFNQFLSGDVEAKNLVLICQHGIRSITAAEALKDKYQTTKNIFSLKGGIARYRHYFKN
ncbi:ThiF family adenylyltransferase [Pedobacter endophyticus]|uniref:Molybdopterin-synthase adenylyltransferase n=1 Tax=Pedobacter endophyticus TaxID=2789740 RepID=A0A7S9L1V2_9SPHI|nr:ThiF family adenylyltransferase [Pedobacter endophyticus]QPH40699.1 ThiF family adenylyltransferase [Pedobacter endophyticus]